jgi:hypothetical protein
MCFSICFQWINFNGLSWLPWFGTSPSNYVLLCIFLFPLNHGGFFWSQPLDYQCLLPNNNVPCVINFKCEFFEILKRGCQISFIEKIMMMMETMDCELNATFFYYWFFFNQQWNNFSIFNHQKWEKNYYLRIWFSICSHKYKRLIKYLYSISWL